MVEGRVVGWNIHHDIFPKFSVNVFGLVERMNGRMGDDGKLVETI